MLARAGTLVWGKPKCKDEFSTCCFLRRVNKYNIESIFCRLDLSKTPWAKGRETQKYLIYVVTNYSYISSDPFLCNTSYLETETFYFTCTKRNSITLGLPDVLLTQIPFKQSRLQLTTIPLLFRNFTLLSLLLLLGLAILNTSP